MDATAQLNGVFVRILETMESNCEAIKKTNPAFPTYWNLFAAPVDKAVYPDYNTWVRPEDEMWLERIVQKARAGAYGSVQDFRADFDKITANMAAYHTPGHGSVPPNALQIQLANIMRTALEQLLVARAAEIPGGVQPLAMPGMPGGMPGMPMPGMGFAPAARPPAPAAAPYGMPPHVPRPIAPAAPVIEKVTWVQCEFCEKWRTLPPGDKVPGEEDEWFCEMKPGFDCNTPLEPGADGP